MGVISMIGEKAQLTKKQQKIYDLYYKQGILQKDIALSLGITQPAVAKTIRKIKKKTVVPQKITGGYIHEGIDTQRGLYGISNFWRVEALSFLIKPYYLFPKYYQIMKKIGNFSIPHKQWRIFLHKDKIRVQLKEGSFFRDPDKIKAIHAAERSFDHFLRFAAEKYGFAYEKEGKVSISCNNMEIEREDSKFADSFIKKTGENFLNVRDHNGKVCFFIDRSKSDEHGYKGKDAFSHSENLEPYLEDFLYNHPLNNSQLTSRIGDLTTVLEKMTPIIKYLMEEKR